MKKLFKKFINKFGYKTIGYLAFYPILLPVLMLVETTLSMRNIFQALRSYQWNAYLGNDQKNAFNNYYYYTQDLNIQKFGRFGKSNLLAGGNFDQKSWFYVTPISLKLQRAFGTTFIMFFAMCFWMLSWVILHPSSPYLWMILFVIMFSTLFFTVFIEIENYNVLGWMLYPVLLWSLTHGNVLLLSVSLLLVSFTSFTAFIFAGFLIFITSIVNADPKLIIATIPSVLVIVAPFIVGMNIQSLYTTFGLIGGHSKVKYERASGKKLSINRAYIFALLLQFLVIATHFQGLSLLLIYVWVFVLLFIVNEIFIRFADQQSFYIGYLSVSAHFLLTSNIDNYVILTSYVLSIYPAYLMIPNARAIGEFKISPGVRKPYNSSKDIANISSMLTNIPKGEKVLVAYQNPKGKYSEVFNGFRVFNEPLQFVAAEKDLTLLPDWYMVMENNSINSTEKYWVDTPQEALHYMNNEFIDYILVPDFLISKNNWLQYFEQKECFQFHLIEDLKTNFVSHGYTLFKRNL